MPRPHLGYRQIAAESPQWTYMASAGLRWALVAYLPLTLGIAWLELRQRLIIGTDGITVVERVGSRSLSWSEISHFDAEDTDVLLVCRSGQTMQIRALRALSMTAEEAMRRVDQLNEALLGATAIDGGTAAGPVWPVWPVWPVEDADAVPPDAVPPADHGLPYRRPKQPTRLQPGRSRLLGVAWIVAVILLLSLPSSSGSTSSSSSNIPAWGVAVIVLFFASLIASLVGFFRGAWWAVGASSGAAVAGLVVSLAGAITDHDSGAYLLYEIAVFPVLVALGVIFVRRRAGRSRTHPSTGSLAPP